MHEASIVESLIALVRENLPGGQRVLRVDVKVGLLTGVSPDAMQFYFELLRPDTLGEQAELAVTLVDLQAHCRECGADHSLAETAWLCPACGAAALVFKNGDELLMTSFEVQDGENIHA